MNTVKTYAEKYIEIHDHKVQNGDFKINKICADGRTKGVVLVPYTCHRGIVASFDNRFLEWNRRKD